MLGPLNKHFKENIFEILTHKTLALDMPKICIKLKCPHILKTKYKNI